MTAGRNISDWLRCCDRCRSCAVPIDLYCEHCWSQVFAHTYADATPACEESTFRVFSLFEWRNDRIGEVIYALKGGVRASAFDRLAGEFSVRRSSAGFVGPGVIVPSPPRPGQRLDHAVVWASALARLWGFPLENALSRMSNDQQKLLSVSERSRKELDLLKNRKGLVNDGERIIFADDVYTTGATARAAYEALGRPSKFEVWTVACRPRLFLV